MIPTPTDEIRAARRELAARLGNDIHLIAEETRRRQQESGRTYVSLPASPSQPGATPNQALHLTRPQSRPRPLSGVVRRGRIPSPTHEEIPMVFTVPNAAGNTPTKLIPKFRLGIIPQAVQFQDPNFGLVFGIEVINIIAGEPAQQSGIEIGDIITRINGAPIHTLADLATAINGSGGSATLRVRDNRSGGFNDVGPITLLAVTVPGGGGGGGLGP